MIEVYCDGSCDYRTREGAWAVVVVTDNQIIWEQCGQVHDTTSNRMELYAIQQALEFMPSVIYSDSAYAVGTITKNWKPTKNLDLIEPIKDKITCQLRWIARNSKPPHARADELSKIALRAPRD